MLCPRCGLTNPKSAMLCDCGFDFIATDPQIEKDKIKSEEINSGKALCIKGLIGIALGIFGLVVIYNIDMSESWRRTLRYPGTLFIAFSFFSMGKGIIKIVRRKLIKK